MQRKMHRARLTRVARGVLTALLLQLFLVVGTLRADVIPPFWQGQVNDIVSRVDMPDGRTPGDLARFRVDLINSLPNNPWTQLNVISLNGLNSSISFVAADSATGNGFSPGLNRLVFGNEDFAPYMHGFHHEGRHAVQAYFQHPGILNSTDPIHRMFLEVDACLPPHGGNVADAFTCAIDRGYTTGIDFLRVTEPGLTDLQRFGVSSFLSTNCPAGILVDGNLTQCAITRYADALEYVNGERFLLTEAELIIPGGVTPTTKSRLARILGVAADSPLMKYLPFVGIGAGLIAVEEARAQGDYMQMCVEIGGLFPVVGEGQAVGELVIKPIGEATGIIDTIASWLIPIFYDQEAHQQEIDEYRERHIQRGQELLNKAGANSENPKFMGALAVTYVDYPNPCYGKRQIVQK